MRHSIKLRKRRGEKLKVCIPVGAAIHIDQPRGYVNIGGIDLSRAGGSHAAAIIKMALWGVRNAEHGAGIAHALQVLECRATVCRFGYARSADIGASSITVIEIAVYAAGRHLGTWHS